MIVLYIILGILVALFVLIPLFLPSKVHVERSIEINAPASTIFKQINSLHNWRNWSPWEEKDPGMKRTYSGPNEGVGSTYEWHGNKKVGQGKMKITKSVSPYELDLDLQFGKSSKTSPCGFKLVESAGKTRVTWHLDVNFGMMLPARYFGLMLPKFIGPDYEQGLTNLKKVAEKGN